MPDCCENFFASDTKCFQFFGLQYFTPALNENCSLRNKIKFKFKILFVAVFSIMLTKIALLIYLVTNHEIMDKNVQSSVMVLRIFVSSFLTFLIILSYSKTKKVIKIFGINEQVRQIFESNLNYNIDFVNLSKNFQGKFYGSTIFFSLCSVSLMVSTCIFETTYDLMVTTVYTIFPYFYIKLFYMHFIYFVLLVRHILVTMNKVVDRYLQSEDCDNFSNNNIVKPKFNKFNEAFFMTNSLKEIYGHLLTVKDEVNDFCGASSMFLLFFTILANSSAGFKIYSTLKGSFPLTQVGSEEQVVKMFD